MTSRRRGAPALGRWMIVGAALSGCAAPERPGAAALDSAGIAIIANTAPLWTEGHGWVVGDSGIVDFRDVGAPATALRLSDGRVVVADGRPVGLKYFSADGRALYTAGGADDGLTALRSLYHLDLARNDTIVAFDLVRHEVVFFDPNGGRVGASPVAPALTTAGSNGFLPKGIAPDGRYLLQRDEAPYPFPGAPGSVRVDSTKLFWLTRAGALADSSPRLMAGELFGFALETVRGQQVVAPLGRPFAPVLRVVAGRDRVWLGDGAAWEVRGLSNSGAVERIIRLPLRRDSLTPAARDTFIARYRERAAGAGRNSLQWHFASRMSDVPFPPLVPAFGDLLAGEDSTLWLLHVTLGDDEPTRWSVIGPDGRWLGDLTLPARFRPTAVGHGWALGIQRDTAGAARVRLYPLVER